MLICITKNTLEISVSAIIIYKPDIIVRKVRFIYAKFTGFLQFINLVQGHTTPDTDTSPTTSPGEDLIKLYFAYGHTENVTETGETTIKENVTIEYRYVPAEKDAQGNATTTPSYEITVTNSGTETVKLKAVLLQTGSGITFYVNGTALQDTTTAQTVEIAPSGGNSDPTP